MPLHLMGAELLARTRWARPQAEAITRRGEFLFQLDPEPSEECVRAYAGIPLFLQAVRFAGCCRPGKTACTNQATAAGISCGGIRREFPGVEALGGDCLEDFERLREDDGLA